MQNYEYLGKPLQIGRLTIRNRFCMAPIGGGLNIIPFGSHQFPASEPPGNFFLESHLRHKI